MKYETKWIVQLSDHTVIVHQQNDAMNKSFNLWYAACKHQNK